MAFFSRAKRTSVAMVRSWASSSMMTEYRLSSGSTTISLWSMPSVMYFIRVAGEVLSSKRIV